MNIKTVVFVTVLFAILFTVTAYILYKNGMMQLESKTSPNPQYSGQTGDNVNNGGNTCSTEFGMIQTSRQSSEGAFTSAITNSSSIQVISPGKLVGDSRFTYLWIKNGQSAPIYAPADGTLVQIFYKTRSDLSSDLSKPDYDMVFLVDCHTMYRINHITDPVADLASQKPIQSPLELKPGSGFNNNDTKPKQNIMVKAGQQIGVTNGTPSAHNFDFGVFVNGMSTCPYEEFNEPIRSEFVALLGNTSRPIKGTACDVSGSY